MDIIKEYTNLKEERIKKYSALNNLKDDIRKKKDIGLYMFFIMSTILITIFVSYNFNQLYTISLDNGTYIGYFINDLSSILQENLKDIEDNAQVQELIVNYRDNIFYAFCVYFASSIFAVGLYFYNESKYQVSLSRHSDDFTIIFFLAGVATNLFLCFFMFFYFVNSNSFIKNIDFIKTYLYISTGVAVMYFLLICFCGKLTDALKAFKNKNDIDSLEKNIQSKSEKIINLEKIITNDPAILCLIADQVKDHVYEEEEKIEIRYLFDIVQKREQKKKENVALSESLHETIKDKFETEESKILNL
tara:strand:- start:43343 stop:44254 length:912 start_codon:yes stop_codon:yes gene_type:complete